MVYLIQCSKVHANINSVKIFQPVKFLSSSWYQRLLHPGN